MKLKENLKFLRKKAGMTQAELAKKLHVKQYNISDYEIGRIEPNIATLTKIADVFQVSIDFLVGRRVKDTSLQDESLEAFDESNKCDKYILRLNEDMKSLTPDQKKAITDLIHFSVGNLLKDKPKNL